METDASHPGGNGSVPMITVDKLLVQPNGGFVQPGLPYLRPSLLTDAPKKSDDSKKKGKVGRPSSKKRTASESSDVESDVGTDGGIYDNGVYARLQELEINYTSLLKKMTAMEKKVAQVVEENGKLKKMVSEVNQENVKLRAWKEDTDKKVNEQPKISYSSVLKSKESELLIKKMARSEVKAVDNIEKNVVISGIKKIGADEKQIEENDGKQVDEVLRVLQLKREDVDSCKRIKTKDESANIIIVRFKEIQYQSRALQNSRALKDVPSLKGVYVNRDKTRAERLEEKEARDSAKAKNAGLSEMDKEGRRYGIDENERKYHYGVRAGEVVKIIHKH
jgi:hypothetical protein